MDRSVDPLFPRAERYATAQAAPGCAAAKAAEEKHARYGEHLLPVVLESCGRLGEEGISFPSSCRPFTGRRVCPRPPGCTAAFRPGGARHSSAQSSICVWPDPAPVPRSAIGILRALPEVMPASAGHEHAGLGVLASGQCRGHCDFFSAPSGAPQPFVVLDRRTCVSPWTESALSK